MSIGRLDDTVTDVLSTDRRQTVDNGYTVATMSTPSNTKTVRVSLENHEQLGALATRLNGTVDDAVNWLFEREELLRLRVSDVQRERWQVQATAAGLPLGEFIAQCTEAAVQYGLDRGGMVLVAQHIREIRALLRANLPQ